MGARAQEFGCVVLLRWSRRGLARTAEPAPRLTRSGEGAEAMCPSLPRSVPRQSKDMPIMSSTARIPMLR
eukprot:12931507-Alexandrium_andersonii.AAC.1